MNKTTKVKLISFFVFPFISYLYSLKNLKSKSSRYIFFMFFVLFGFTFNPTDIELDSYRYKEYFNQDVTKSTTYFIEYVSTYFKFESEKSKDIYLRICYGIVSRVTDNYHFLFALFSFVFAFFYLKTFKFLTNNNNFKNALPFYFLSFLFVLSNPIFNINGVRFWTASWIAVYAMFQIFINKEKKYIFLALITPLVHAAFFLYLLILILIFLTQKFEKFWLITFIISLFVSGASFLIFADKFTDYLPPFLQKLVYLYTESDDALAKMAGIKKHIIIQVVELFPRIFIAITIFLFIKNKKQIYHNTISKIFYRIILIWYSFVFFTLNIPSVGSRFFLIGIPFIIYLWIDSYEHMKKYNKWIIYIMPIAFSYQIWGWIIKMSLVSEPYLFYSTFIHIFYSSLIN